MATSLYMSVKSGEGYPVSMQCVLKLIQFGMVFKHSKKTSNAVSISHTFRQCCQYNQLNHRWGQFVTDKRKPSRLFVSKRSW